MVEKKVFEFLTKRENILINLQMWLNEKIDICDNTINDKRFMEETKKDMKLRKMTFLEVLEKIEELENE